MAQYAKHVKAEDRVEPSTRSRVLEMHRLVGTWINTNHASRGIAKVILIAADGRLFVHVFGACDPTPCHWGEVEADDLYSDSIGSQSASAFTAQYRFDFAETRLQANWNQGLLVVGSFSTFTDGSKRSNYFSREFFRREGA
ncbi:MAG TPA: hypothetical protein VG488_10930 [Candidatus Angelobacter sp.]|jgi:hypothetical protein|nr:hypothetical protein [Candidatus Angelobacter sp.]